MKSKTALTVIIIFSFLISLTVGLQTVEVAKANFFLGPALGIESPISKMVYTNTSVPLKIVAHVPNPTPEVVSITYNLDENSNVTLTNLNKTLRIAGHIDGSEFSAELILENLAEGNHTLKVYSQDASGLEMSASVEFIIDTHYTSPLTVLSPQNITYTTTDVPLTYFCRDEITSADYQLDHIGEGPISGNLTMTGLSLGSHKIVVVVWTEHGVFSETIYFTIKNPPLEPIFSIPKEYLNYTITRQNGDYWAIIDGTYPIYCFNAEDAWSTSMVYPIPPGTLNISIRLNETLLSWRNFTEMYPDALHHTALSDWAMIETSFQPSDYFVLSIHYEHPIILTNGTYQFLYDLNISPYLSPSNPNSTAYFNLKTEHELTNLKVFTIPSDEVRNQIEYIINQKNKLDEAEFAVTSEYSSALPGDVLVTFSNSETQTQEPLQAILIGAALFGVVALVVGALVYFKKRGR